MHATDAAARDWLWSHLLLAGQFAGDWGPSLLLGAMLTVVCAAAAAVGWGMRKNRLR